MSASMYVGRLGGLAVGLGIGVAIGAGMSAASAAPSDSSPSGASTPRPAATGPVAAAKATVARAVVSRSPRITRVPVTTNPLQNPNVFQGQVFATGTAPLVYGWTPGAKADPNAPATVINPNTGEFQWTAAEGAAHAAAKIGAGIQDTQPLLRFTVTNNVYPSRPAVRTVRVRLVPMNETPDVNTSDIEAGQTVDNYPTGSGKTFGNLLDGVSDADDDVLSFSGSKTYAAGIFTVSKAGLWNFAPTFAAAHAAALTAGAVTETTVSFAVDDGYKFGKVLGNTFSVQIAKYNRTPEATQYTIGTPSTSESSTTVGGTVFGTDPDNDTLTYGISGQADYGTASVNSSSGVYSYTYTNTGSSLPVGVTWTDLVDPLIDGTYHGTIPFTVSMNDAHNGNPWGSTANGIGTFEVTVPLTYILDLP